MKKLHEKELFEYTQKDHYNMAIWHLRRIGVPDSAMKWYMERITTMFEEYNKSK